MPSRAAQVPEAAGPPEVVGRLRRVALDGAEVLMAIDPVLGDHTTQLAVDHLVDHAADALRALAEILAQPVMDLQTSASPITGFGATARGGPGP